MFQAIYDFMASESGRNVLASLGSLGGILFSIYKFYRWVRPRAVTLSKSQLARRIAFESTWVLLVVVPITYAFVYFGTRMPTAYPENWEKMWAIYPKALVPTPWAWTVTVLLFTPAVVLFAYIFKFAFEELVLGPAPTPPFANIRPPVTSYTPPAQLTPTVSDFVRKWSDKALADAARRQATPSTKPRSKS